MLIGREVNGGGGVGRGGGGGGGGVGGGWWGWWGGGGVWWVGGGVMVRAGLDLTGVGRSTTKAVPNDFSTTTVNSSS